MAGPQPEDPSRKLLRDVRVRRRAVSDQSAQIIGHYYGLARALTQFSRVRFISPNTGGWARFDLKRANELLDEAGLAKRDRDGIRLLPDGRRAEIVIETAGESTEQSDVLALIRDTWLKVGIKIYVRPTQRDLFRKRIYSGSTVMSVWSGLDNAVATPDMSPHELAPTSQAQLQWPKWGQHYEEKGMVGEPPDLPEVRRLLELYEAWRVSKSSEERTEIWHEMLRINADQVFSIGTVNGARQPIVFAKNLVNVPEEGIWAFDPGGYFGRYCRTPSGSAKPSHSRSSGAMLSYIIRRILMMIPTLLLTSVLVFTIMELPPGDYFESYMAELQAQGEGVDKSKIEFLKREYGFDKHPVERYFIWLTGMLQGDFGYSFEYQMPVSDLIGSRIFLTILVSFATILLTWLIAFPIGIYSATHQYSWGDYGLTFLGMLGIAIPNFLLALVLMYLANVWFGTSIGHLMAPEFIDQPMSWAKFKSILAHMWIPLVIGTLEQPA